MLIDARVGLISIVLYMIMDVIMFVKLYGKKVNKIAIFSILVINFICKIILSKYSVIFEAADYLYILLMYLMFADKKQLDYECLNLLLFGDVLASTLYLVYTSIYVAVTGALVDFVGIGINIIIVILIYRWIIKNGREFWKKDLYIDFRKILPWIFIVMIITLLLKSILLDRLTKYDYYTRAMSVLIYVMILFIMMISLIIYLRTFLKTKYHHEYQELRIEELKRYNDTISSHQEKIRKFKHDYKNLLLVANSLLETGRYEELQTYFQELTTYSEKYLQQDIDALQDIRNVQHLALRQVLVEKINKISMSGINCIFECRDIVEKINIPAVDLVRIVSILLDNAWEAARESQEKMIEIVMLSDNGNFELEIRNSTVAIEHSVSDLVKSGVSTKGENRGLGLSNIEELKQQYPQLLTEFHMIENLFSVTVYILDLKPIQIIDEDDEWDE